MTWSSPSRVSSKRSRSARDSRAARKASEATPSAARSPKRRSSAPMKSWGRLSRPKTSPPIWRRTPPRMTARSKSSQASRPVPPRRAGSSWKVQRGGSNQPGTPRAVARRMRSSRRVPWRRARRYGGEGNGSSGVPRTGVRNASAARSRRRRGSWATTISSGLLGGRALVPARVVVGAAQGDSLKP